MFDGTHQWNLPEPEVLFIGKFGQEFHFCNRHRAIQIFCFIMPILESFVFQGLCSLNQCSLFHFRYNLCFFSLLSWWVFLAVYHNSFQRTKFWFCCFFFPILCFLFHWYLLWSLLFLATYFEFNLHSFFQLNVET